MIHKRLLPILVLALAACSDAPVDDSAERVNQIASNAASASFRNTSSKDRPEYYKMIGAKFDHHPKMHSFEINLEEGNELLDASFANYSVFDELYFYSNYQTSNKVLLTANYNDEKSPMAWVKTYGKGKVFFTALGHSPAVTADKNFQKLILFAVDWLLEE